MSYSSVTSTLDRGKQMDWVNSCQGKKYSMTLEAHDKHNLSNNIVNGSTEKHSSAVTVNCSMSMHAMQAELAFVFDAGDDEVNLVPNPPVLTSQTAIVQEPDPPQHG